MSSPIRLRDKLSLLNSLRNGVPPSRGFAHIQVGRLAEVEALDSDIQLVKEGGCAVRMVMGDYGSGKSFFLLVMRSHAQKQGCVTMSADLTANVRLVGGQGRVRNLISALFASTATKSQVDGGALGEVLDSFVDKCQDAAQDEGRELLRVARDRLSRLRNLRSGAEFVEVIVAYVRAARDSDSELRDACLKWLRAEYRLKSEARTAIGVNGMLSDSDLFAVLQLFALLCRLAGYKGLVVGIDEMTLLGRYNKPVRDANYEEILTMVNSLAGDQAEGLAIFFAGTDEFVQNAERGLYSYGALRSRLAPNSFISKGMVDVRGPVLALDNFGRDNLQVLLERLHRVYISNGQRPPLADEAVEVAIDGFLEHQAGQLGGLSNVTARQASKEFLQFLDALDQNRGKSWQSLLQLVTAKADVEPAMEPLEDEEFDAHLAAVPQQAAPQTDADDPFATFRV